jgi:hypothetical protein
LSFVSEENKIVLAAHPCNIASGARNFVNGEEITTSKVAKATAIIGLMTALIAAYGAGH